MTAQEAWEGMMPMGSEIPATGLAPYNLDDSEELIGFLDDHSEERMAKSDIWETDSAMFGALIH